jgi:hypothetical protein
VLKHTNNLCTRVVRRLTGSAFTRVVTLRITRVLISQPIDKANPLSKPAMSTPALVRAFEEFGGRRIYSLINAELRAVIRRHRLPRVVEQTHKFPGWESLPKVCYYCHREDTADNMEVVIHPEELRLRPDSAAPHTVLNAWRHYHCYLQHLDRLPRSLGTAFLAQLKEGGRCFNYAKCGRDTTNTPLSYFQFHHPAPELKTISLGCVAVACDLPGFNIDFLAEEFKHCILACRPCHDEISVIQTHRRPPGNDAAFPVDPAAITQITAMTAEIDAWLKADTEYTNYLRLKYARRAKIPQLGRRPKTRSQRPTPLSPNLWALLTRVRYPNNDATDPYSGVPPPPSPAPTSLYLQPDGTCAPKRRRTESQ